MLPDISVRPAMLPDIPSIAALEGECFTAGRDSDMISRHLSDFLVAEQNDTFSGYADFSTVLDEGYIGNIAVLPSCRNCGIGRTLLHAMLQRAKEQQLSFLTLEVRESNLPAVTLYERSGFQKVGVRKKYYEKPAEDALLYTYYF